MSEMSSTDLLRETAGEVQPWLKKSPWLLFLPSVLLGVGSVLDIEVSPLHSVAPALVGVAKGLGWGLYLRAAMGASGGAANGSALTPVICMAIAFVGLEFGDWGLLAPIIMWLLPMSDYAGMYGEGPDGALGGVLDTIKAAPVLWFGTMLALLIALIMFGLVLSLPMSIYSTYAHPEGAWLANLSGGILVGPLVHLAVVYRARLFLAIHGDPA
jgi:hypothetical protein